MWDCKNTTDRFLHNDGRLSNLRRRLSYGARVWMQAFAVFPCIRFEEGIGRKDNAVEAVRLFAAQSPQFSF